MMTRLAQYVTALVFVLGLATEGSQAAAQGPPAPQLLVTGAVADASSQTLTISGENFGARPFVTLDLVPIAARSATDSQIVAAVPVNMIPPGTYLLTVSRGPSASETGSFQLTLGGGKPKSDPAATSNPLPLTLGPSGTEPAAKVGDRVITVAEVDQEWRRTDPGRYVGLSREIYENRRRVTELMVTNELLAREAAARALGTQALLDQEIPKRIVTMPESAVLSLYQSLGDRSRGATLDQMRPALRAWLERMTEPEIAKMNYVEELMKVSTRGEVLLVAPRVHVDRTAQDAVLGPSTATIEIVAFGDFQSPEYARFARVFGKVRDTFGERVRFVFKNLPMLGPVSVVAAEAAACANAQRAFWTYHDAVVAQPGPLGSERLKQLAGDVGLDRAAFEACLDGGTFRQVIREARDEATRYGVTSTPSFLVNGRLAPAAPPFLPPFEFFTRIIEQELLHQSRAGSKGR